MADRITIMGNEPYAEWIERDDNAQRLFKEYCAKWPNGNTQCVAISREFYVRSNNGDGMRRVYNMCDFDNEDEWCAQCGTPINPDGDEYYCCDVYGCDAVLCEYCGGSMTGNYYCPRHRGAEAFMDAKEPSYVYPYAFGNGNQFTFGVEIELESELSDDFVENVTNSDIIAGWGEDASLEHNGVELQSNILDMSKLPDLQRIVEGIPEYGDNAGGHIHVARTPNQCASRWFWALHGLDAAQCRLLNMRHIDDDYWCSLTHGEYTGKHTAVNDEHADTIELRTFDCWYEGTADRLVPAVKWIRAMWRFFEKHPRGTVSASLIERYTSCMADNVTDTPRRTLDERLAVARSVKAARKAEEERERQERAAEIRRNVKKNVAASRAARCSHGETLFATLEYRRHEKRRERGRNLVKERLSAPELCYALPSRNLRPLHHYTQMATVMSMAGVEPIPFYSFRLYHAYGDKNLWRGYEYVNRHGETAMRVVANIVRSRVARASHGKPTVEPLERTALRLYKRAGRPELNACYARIRKNIGATRGND
jgi:hypothetical protein|nr:MAG TPA: putative cytoplasmic protein [Caudoviricetes sp.]